MERHFGIFLRELFFIKIYLVGTQKNGFSHSNNYPQHILRMEKIILELSTPSNSTPYCHSEMTINLYKAALDLNYHHSRENQNNYVEDKNSQASSCQEGIVSCQKDFP